MAVVFGMRRVNIFIPESGDLVAVTPPSHLCERVKGAVHGFQTPFRSRVLLELLHPLGKNSVRVLSCTDILVEECLQYAPV